MTNSVWAIILAAGESKRFNGIKAMAEWQGETLLNRAVNLATSVTAHNTVMVYGAYDLEVPKSVMRVYNPEWPLGMGSSLACGLRWLDNHGHRPDGILVLTVDQPRITDTHLKTLVHKGRSENTNVLTTDGVTDGPPAYIRANDFNVLKNLKDDYGAKKHLETYTTLKVAKEQFADIDYK